MEKAYEKIVFVNDQAPDLDADNLNSISDAIDTIDDRVVEQDALIDGLDTRVSTNTTNISTNTADIADLKSNTGFEISSASPLNGCSASSIVGIDVDGCSTQATAISTVQGGIGGSGAINQSVTSRADRCTSEIRNLTANTVIGITSGYSFATDYSATASGEITNYVDWQTSYTIPTNGYYRFIVKKTDGSSLTPSSFSLSISPTPTNPIAIVDASGDVIAHNEYVYDGTLLQGYWDATSGAFVSNSANVCCADYIPCSGSVCVKYATTITRIAIAWYNGTTFIRRDNFDGVSKASANVPTNATCFKFNINRMDGITPSSALEITIQSASNKITLPTLRSVGTVKDELIVNADGGSKTVSVLDYEITEISDVIASPDYGNYVNVTLPSNVQNIAPMHSAFKGCTYQDRIADANAYRVYVSSTTSGNTVTFRIPKGISITKAEMLAMAQLSHLRCALATPTTETLTSSQVASIRQLQTYSGTTIIDSALDVKSVTYHAGVKEYIDWRFEQLATLMLGEE